MENNKAIVGEWTNVKPEFDKPCILITANWWRDHWEYDIFTIEKAEVDEGWYWGIFEDGSEWGDISDLAAQYYKVLEPLPNPPLK